MLGKLKLLQFIGNGTRRLTFIPVSPVHPEYCEMPLPGYNPERAKQLLADAGYSDGLDVELAVGSGWSDVVSYAEVLKEDAAPVGFNITLNPMPNSQYWEQWTEVALGITPWTHRSLGTMVLNLAYTGDEQGNPTPWNETRWVDEEFSQLLNKASRTLDVEARREIFCQLQQIQYERGSIGIPYWKNIWSISREEVEGIVGHPSYYMHFHDVWLDQ